MSRWTSSANEAAAELGHVIGAYLLALDFVAGFVRANDTAVELIVGADTYFPSGTFGTFQPIEESIRFVAKGCQFELGGVAASLISTVMDSRQYQGRAATLYIGLLDGNNQWIDTPEIEWAGYMDTMEIEKRGKEAKIILNCEHRQRFAPQYNRWSDADQQARSTYDRFFNQCHFVSTYTSTWGGKSTTYGPKPGGGYGPG